MNSYKRATAHHYKVRSRGSTWRKSLPTPQLPLSLKQILLFSPTALHSVLSLNDAKSTNATDCAILLI